MPKKIPFSFLFSKLKKAYLYCYKCVYFSKTGNVVLLPTIFFFFRKSFSLYKMVKKVDKESSASPMVKKSGAKAAKGLGLDKVKSAMTPDKVKISTPAKSEKKKVR